MSVFKTEWVVLQVWKISEKELFYKIIFRDYGILTVKKRKKAREKPIDIGYHVNCEIITHKDQNIHTVGNIKILHFFSVEKRKYSEIEAFLKILSKVSKQLPIWNPHYEIYDILTSLIYEEKNITYDSLLLTHIKIIQCLWILQDSHNHIGTDKTLKYMHVHWYKNILKLWKIPEEIQKNLEWIL